MTIREPTRALARADETTDTKPVTMGSPAKVANVRGTEIAALMTPARRDATRNDEEGQEVLRPHVEQAGEHVGEARPPRERRRIVRVAGRIRHHRRRRGGWRARGGGARGRAGGRGRAGAPNPPQTEGGDLWGGPTPGPPAGGGT